MYSLYQSSVWQTLQGKIYHKSHGVITLFGKEYFYLIKQKKVGPFSFREFQVLGVQMPQDQKDIKMGLKKLKTEFGKQWGNIFFQLGCINEITHFDSNQLKDAHFSHTIRTMRLTLSKKICKEYSLRIAFKENMPQTTLVVALDKSDEAFLKSMQNGSANKIKKAKNKGIQIRLGTFADQEIFFKKWQSTAGTKGFSTITKKQYDDLIQALSTQNLGNFFIAELNGEIIAGSICLFVEKTIVYLYGFADRRYTNLGAHHYLKYQMFIWARDHGFEYCDLMGGAPTGFDNHSLAGVSKFKESLGGEKIEFYGNFDLVLNPLLYFLFRGLTWIKKKLKSL